MLESIMSAGGETAGGGYPRPPHTLTLPSYPPSALTSMMGKIWGLNSLLSPPNSDIADQEDNKSGKFIFCLYFHHFRNIIVVLI